MNAAENLELARPDVSGLFESVLAGGYSVRLQVTGRSMEPFLRGGEVLIIEPVEGRRLGVGDIVLFKDVHEHWIIHRVVRMRGGLIQTQGDALNEPDAPVEIARLMGKVERVEGKGTSLDLERWPQRLRGWFLARSRLWRRLLRRSRSLLGDRPERR